MVTATTQGIKISIETFFQADHSNEKKAEFVFAYHITIENKSAIEIQLLRREWNIYDSTGEWRYVSGEGVVGEQPVIKPGGLYQYISGCHLRTTIGKMFGKYLMTRLNDHSEFEVDIPEFCMIAPQILN